jgi:hypothetical protein
MMKNKDTENKSELSEAFSSILNTIRTLMREVNSSI